MRMPSRTSLRYVLIEAPPVAFEVPPMFAVGAAKLNSEAAWSCSTTRRASGEQVRIELPHAVIEHGRIHDPGEVGQEQCAGERPNAPEGGDGCDDQSQQRDDVDQGQQAESPGEEEPAPECIDAELEQEQDRKSTR